MTGKYLKLNAYYCTMHRRIAYRCLGILLLTLITYLAMGSQRYRSSVTLNEGLPSNNIHQVFSDSRHIVWVATDAGFFEFDGGKVKFRKELERLYGEKVVSISEDAKANLWIAAVDVGLCRFDGLEVKIFDLRDFGLSNELQSIYYMADQDILIAGTTEGVYRIDISNINALSIIPFESNRRVDVSHFIERNKKLVAISKNSAEVFECNFETGELDFIEQDEFLPVIQFNRFHTSILANNLALTNEAFRLRVEGCDDLICEIIQSQHGKLESFYLVRYFEKGIEYRKVLRLAGQEIEDFSKVNGIDDIFIQSVFIDIDESNIWLASRNKGIIRLQNSKFQYFNASYFDMDKLDILDLETDEKGNIYFATNKEIIYFKEGKILKRISTSKLCSIKEGHNSAVCEEEILIYDILNDGKSKLWFATNLGFFTLDLRDDSIAFLGISPASKFIFTPEGHLLCTWKNEILVFSGEKFENKFFSQKLSKSVGFDFSKLALGVSEVWISTEQKGILRYSSGVLKHFNRDNSGIHNVINDLLLLPDGNLVAGGNNGIIYKLKYVDEQLKISGKIDRDLGLMGTSIQGFQYLKDGSLWCGTNKGVYRFDYASWKQDSAIEYRFWDEAKGYHDRSGKSSIVDKDQNIWVQTSTQLLKIDNSSIDVHNNSRCNLILQNIQIYNKDWHPDASQIDTWSKRILSPVNLSHNQNYLTFLYGFQNCLNPGKSVFRFRLDGFDSEWSDWSSNTQAVYSNLPSGDYVLNIQGKHLNRGDIIPLTIRVSIAFPWWQKAWFYAIVFSIAVALLIGGMRIYTRSIRQEEEDRNKVSNSILGLKMKTLQNQLDPHFIFNALNSIQGYILEEETENALDYLSDFSTVLRKNIDNADKDFISLSDEVAYLKHYVKLEQMRFMDRFIFEIGLSKLVNPYNYFVPPMLIQPFVESAIKYGLSACNGDGLILINFELEDDSYIRCTIEDNGIGRSVAKTFDAESRQNSHERTMQIVQERISLLNRMNNDSRKYDYKIFDLYDEKQRPIGTKVEIGLPFKKMDA